MTERRRKASDVFSVKKKGCSCIKKIGKSWCRP